MTKNNSQKVGFQWTFEDHLCRFCGGRILKKASASGMTPGGNPIFICADCERLTCGITCEELCWCGFKHKGQSSSPYRCLSFRVLDANPKLIKAFKNCGCDPERGLSKVGIVLSVDYQLFRKEGELDFDRL